jgi:3-hydroxyisobutyrate dehydrogenase
MLKIGFVGVGGIGRPMAERLLGRGFDLTVCDIDAAALDRFRSLGARAVTEAADCAGCDAVVLMVANDEQIANVSLGPRGLLAGIDPARPPLIAIMSSVLPRTIDRVASALSQKKARVVDAPVSGGSVRAAAGELTIMVGGAAADHEALSPVFNALGKKIIHCGPLGRAAAIKIVNNVVGVANTFIMAEAMRIAGGLGLPQALLIEVMESGSGRNYATADYSGYLQMIRTNCREEMPLQALLGIVRKDLDLALTLAGDLGLAAPVVDAIAATARSIDAPMLLPQWRSLLG